MKNNTGTEKSKSSLSTAKTKKASPANGGHIEPRSERRMKGRIMAHLMQPLTPLLMEIDKTLLKRPVFDHAMDENIKHGFKGRYPTLRIDYPKLILSKGTLPNPPDLAVTSPKRGKLVFNWTDDRGIAGSLPSDRLFVAVFSWKSLSWIVGIRAAKRSACNYSLDASPFQGEPVQIYAGFISEDSERISTSLYLGEMRVL